MLGVPGHGALDVQLAPDPVGVQPAEGLALLVRAPVEDEPVVEDALREATIGAPLDLLPEECHVQNLAAVDERLEVAVLLERALTPLIDALLNAAVQREGLRRPEDGALSESGDKRQIGRHLAWVFTAFALRVNVTPDQLNFRFQIFFILIFRDSCRNFAKKN